MSSEKKESHHKQTKRLSESELASKNKDEEEDPVISQLSKMGCLEKHYNVQDCYFETKDWRKCTKETKEFQDCVKNAYKDKEKL